MISLKEYQRHIINPDVACRLNLRNSMEVPKIINASININYASNITRAVYVMQLLFNRKPKLISAKKSIAGFNLREGTITSYKISLNGDEAYDFISTLANIIVPRLKDNNSRFEIKITENGNIDIGIDNIKIFPKIENEYDKIASNIGMNINISTSKSNITFIRSLFNYLHLTI